MAKKVEKKAAVKPTRRAAAKAALTDDAPLAAVSEPAIHRPISLDEVAGHAQPKATLRSAIKSGRVHHAWVFAGEPGVGKFTTALAFAAELLLPQRGHEDRPELEALLQHAGHPDLHVITKELAAASSDPDIRKLKQTNIPKAVLDEFLIGPATKTCSVTTSSAVGKVFIIDEAELIDPVGQNTILKTLEEPPTGTVIILVTSVESRLLPTIRSRCQRVAFGSLCEEDVLACLQRARVEMKPAERSWVLAYARGAPGAAVNAIENGLYTWHTELSSMLEAIAKGQGGRIATLGSAMSKQVESRAAAAVDNNAKASKDAANRLWAKRMLGFVAEQFRASVGDARSRDAALRGIDLCREAELQIDSNVNYSTVLENLGAQLGS